MGFEKLVLTFFDNYIPVHVNLPSVEQSVIRTTGNEKLFGCFRSFRVSWRVTPHSNSSCNDYRNLDSRNLALNRLYFQQFDISGEVKQ